MEKISKIVFIGAGNVATNLAIALHNKGVSILQVVSRTIESARELALKVNADFCDNFSEISQDADLYIISVNDDAIFELSEKLNLKRKNIVHTSGSLDISVLCNISDSYGVFYPLQTFSKEELISFTAIPICIEANNLFLHNQLIELAKKISENVRIINSEERKVLHISAVFACNYSSYMYLISSDILKDKGLSFDLLKPLIQRTAEKIKSIEPAQAITGPAKRNDIETIKKHLAYLDNLPELKRVYKVLSDSIIVYFKKQKNNVKL